MVSTKVVADEREFKQVIYDANDSRKMGTAEVRNHKLSARGVKTQNEDVFYLTVRRARKSEMASAFATACRFPFGDKPQIYIDKFFRYTSSAFTRAQKVSKTNKNFLEDLIIGESRDEDLRALAKNVAHNYVNILEDGRMQYPQFNETRYAPRIIAKYICSELSLEQPSD